MNRDEALIVAGALIRPEKKLAAVDVAFLLNRFNEKSFARGANREQIAAAANSTCPWRSFWP